MRAWACVGLLAFGCEPEEKRPTEYAPNVPDVRSVDVRPDRVDFGNVAAGNNAFETVVVYNDSDAPIQITDAILNPAGEQVTLPMSLHDGIIGGIYIPPGGDYRFDLSWFSEAGGSFEGELQIWLAANSLKQVEVVGSSGN